MKHFYLPVIFLLILAAACNKTENFYNQLDNLPRIDKLAANAYAVGDTLMLTGKFGAGKANLSVKIGGEDAPVISMTTYDSLYVDNEVNYNYTKDKIKMLITEQMIGLQQPVVATINNVSTTVAVILVAREKPIATRTDTLTYLNPEQARIALSLPVKTRAVPNYKPGSPIIFVTGDSVISWQEGVVRRGKMAWEDEHGPFTVLDPANVQYGYASDPDGNNLYISCLTKDDELPNATFAAIRLMKVSMQDYSLTTLNRTVVPTGPSIDAMYVDLDTAKREGNIGEVFMPLVKKMYVNKAGDIYFTNPSFNWTVNASSGVVGSATVTKNITTGVIDAAGTLKYLTKSNTTTSKVFMVPFRKDGKFSSTYDFIPNVTNMLSYTRLLGIDAENGILYGYDGSPLNSTIFNITAFYCYSLTQQRQLSEFTYKFSDDKATITAGPFDVVDGKYQVYDNNTYEFQWFSPKSMVIFAMQRSRRLDGLTQTVNILNFNDRTVTPYAPYLWTGDDIYRAAIGGNVVGYTLKENPIMVLTPGIDPL